MSKHSLSAPLTATQCASIREFLGGIETALLFITASQGQKAREEADKRGASPDVLGLLAEIQCAGMPEGLRQAWLIGYRLKDDPRPGCS
jgi:hypothetical protein